jgi:hypothetical protein
MKKEIIISKTNIHSIRNALTVDTIIDRIKGKDFVKVDMYEVCTNEAHIILNEGNKTFTPENTIKLIAEEIKNIVSEDSLKWDATNPDIVTGLSSALFTFTVQDCVALYNILLNKKQTLKLDKNQSVIRDTFTRWYVQLFKDLYEVLDKKIMLKLEKEPNNKYYIWATLDDKDYARIHKSKKLSKIWEEEALDLLMIINYKKGDKTAQILAKGGNKTIDLNNDTFEYLMNIPGFHNCINDYLRVL